MDTYITDQTYKEISELSYLNLYEGEKISQSLISNDLYNRRYVRFMEGCSRMQ